MKQYSFLLQESINTDNSYKDALNIFNTLSEEEKWFTCPRSGFLKNVPTLYRHVIKNKGFIDIYPYNNNKEIGFVIIAVNPKYRQQGITHQLIDQCVKDCKKLNIKKLHWRCDSKNIISYHVAKRNGFKLKTKGKSYYSLELKIN